MHPPALDLAAPVAMPTVAEIAAREGSFLWLTLQRMGVRRDDCADVLQNVLLVVHQKLHTFDSRGPLRAWLYGVCLREASVHRRRAWVRRELPVAPSSMPDSPSREADPEGAALSREQRGRFDAMLDELDADKRAVLVMYEIEEQPCEEIAAMLGVPVGTVHSRLHAARNAFRAVLERSKKRDARGGTR